MKIGILFLIVGIATACSSDPAKPAPQNANQNAKVAQTDDAAGTICTYERPTGSFMKEKRCTTAAEREAAKQQKSIMMDSRNMRDSGIN